MRRRTSLRVVPLLWGTHTGVASQTNAVCDVTVVPAHSPSPIQEWSKDFSFSRVRCCRGAWIRPSAVRVDRGRGGRSRIKVATGELSRGLLGRSVRCHGPSVYGYGKRYAPARERCGPLAMYPQRAERITIVVSSRALCSQILASISPIARKRAGHSVSPRSLQRRHFFALHEGQKCG